MKQNLLFAVLLFLVIFPVRADKIYIKDNSGYITCAAEIQAALIANGHTLTLSYGGTNLPVGFTSTLIDSVNGYDWLCLFGNTDYSTQAVPIKAFIDAGGKVFYQYEVDCCTTASAGAAALASALTGLNITASPIANVANAYKGWADSLENNCVTFVGGAYKGLNGLPPANQFNATHTLNNALPPISVCTNFGFHFSTTDFIGTAHRGAFLGMGDIQPFYDSGEPFWNGGSTPVDMNIINFFFPNALTTCYLYPPGPVPGTNTVLQAVASGTNASCYNSCNGTATVVASLGTPPYFYNWQPGNYTTATVNNLCPANYIVVVTDINGASITDSVLVTSPAAPVATITATTNSICANDSAQLCVAQGFANYLWNTTQSTACITASQAGTYHVTVTDNNSCTALSDSVTIAVHPLPVVSVQSAQHIFCSGDSNQVCATAASVSYLWNTGETTPCIYAYHAGNYYVTVADTNNCSAVSTHLAINIYPIPPVSISVNGDTLTSFNGVTYQWYLNGNQLLNAYDSVYVAKANGLYMVAITDSNGCRTVSNPVNVVVNGVTSYGIPNAEFRIYPNPASDQLFIEANGAEIKQVNIYNTLGEVVLAVHLTTNYAILNTVSLPTGVYIAEIKTKDAIVKKRWVKE